MAGGRERRSRERPSGSERDAQATFSACTNTANAQTRTGSERWCSGCERAASCSMAARRRCRWSLRVGVECPVVLTLSYIEDLSTDRVIHLATPATLSLPSRRLGNTFGNRFRSRLTYAAHASRKANTQPLDDAPAAGRAQASCAASCSHSSPISALSFPLCCCARQREPFRQLVSLLLRTPKCLVASRRRSVLLTAWPRKVCSAGSASSTPRKAARGGA